VAELSAYIRLLKKIHPWVDPNEAPPGYRAVAKTAVYDSLNVACPPNLCRKCDWRSKCSGEHPCTSYRRKDGQSVVFKKVEEVS